MKINKKYRKALVLAIGFGALQSSGQEDESSKVIQQVSQNLEYLKYMK